MELTELNIGIFGLSNTERAAVSSVCNLTKHRKRRYQVSQEPNNNNVHIALVDGDDPEARRRWTASSPFQAGRPALLIARDPDNGDKDGFTYTMNRGYFAGRLIRTLDEVAMQQFRSLPEMKVDDAGHVPQVLHQGTRNFGNADSPTALVVDDSEVVRMQMRTLLELSGMRVMAVESAEQALEAASRHNYDIIFLDIELPEMDGYTACRKLKNRGKAVECPVVMLTSRDSAFDRIRGVMAGCSRYMIKPVAAEDLYSVLNQFVPRLQAKAS
jgi:twitching motility two-component system response regulator PilG